MAPAPLAASMQQCACKVRAGRLSFGCEYTAIALAAQAAKLSGTDHALVNAWKSLTGQLTEIRIDVLRFDSGTTSSALPLLAATATRARIKGIIGNAVCCSIS